MKSSAVLFCCVASLVLLLSIAPGTVYGGPHKGRGGGALVALFRPIVPTYPVPVPVPTPAPTQPIIIPQPQVVTQTQKVVKYVQVPVPVQQPAPAVEMPAPKPKGASWSMNPPQLGAEQTLDTIHLPDVVQPYQVPSSFTTQENIKQPIIQPVHQPYLQRYVNQAQPIVQPIVNRVIQPVIHRQLKPSLTSETVQGPAAFTNTLPAQYNTYTNEPIVGSDYPAEPMVNLQPSPKPMEVQMPLAPSKSSSSSYQSLGPSIASFQGGDASSFMGY